MSGFDLKSFADAKGLPVEYLRTQGVNNGEDERGRRCVIFTYRDENGVELIHRYRYAIDGSGKFKWPKGTSTTWYGQDSLPEARKAGHPDHRRG
jgi:hypothetical protein